MNRDMTQQAHKDLMITLLKGTVLGIVLSVMIIIPYDRFAEKRVRMPNLTAEERVVFEEINDFRQKRGLSPLELHPKLVLAARDQAKFEVKAEKVANEDYKRVAREFERNNRNLDFKRIESVAISKRSPEQTREAVRQWLATDQGRKSAEGDFAYTGIGLAVNDKGQTYIAKVFAL